MVLFILVYVACAVAATGRAAEHSGLAGAGVQMTADGNAIQYLQFEDLSYNITDFTICAWIKFSNFSQTQTIFRLMGSKKENVVLWRMHVHPKESMRVTINTRLVASEAMQLVRGRWSHVCFQWKGPTGVWAMFVDAKIHSVGQTPAAVGNDTTTKTKAHGTGTGVVGDDVAPSRNGWQAYGVYMTGGESPSTSPATPAATTAAAPAVAPNVTANATDGPKKPAAKNTSKRQAVFDSDGDDAAAATPAPPKPFQWFTKTFAFLKRMFTFVIIPFFKFVRNTFFQTRSVDDTVVDVSETHLTVSDEKYDPPPTTTSTVAAAVASTTAAAATTAGTDGGDDDVAKRQSSASKRETDGGGGGGGGGDRCGAAAADRVTAADLASADAVAAAAAVADGTTAAAAGRELSPNALRYLRLISDGLNDVGVNAAFVRRTYACCARPFEPGRPAAAILDWDRSRATAHNVTVVPHVCGRQ